MGYVILKAAFTRAEERPFLKSLSCDNSVPLARLSIEASSAYRREGRFGLAFLCILQKCLLINLLMSIKDSLI